MLTDGEKLKDLGLIQGDTNGNLMENESLNRAELAVILAQLTKTMGEASTYDKDMGYTDVDANAWYASYVNYAISQGWLKGVGDKVFDPNGTVTEEMVATVFLRVLDYDPPWGEAVLRGKALGVDVKTLDDQKILRSEVFSYMYSVLDTKLKEDNITLAEKIEVSLDNRVTIGRKYDWTSETYVYINPYGDVIDGSIYLVPSQFEEDNYDTLESNEALYSDITSYLSINNLEADAVIFDEETYLVPSGEDSLKKVNILTGEEIEVTYDEGLVIETLGWDRTLGYGLINSGEMLIDDNLNVVLAMSEGKYVGYQNNDMACKDIQISFIGHELLVIYNEEHNEGVMNLTGDMVFDFGYNAFSEYKQDGDTYIKVAVYGEYDVYDPGYVAPVEVYNIETLEEVKILPKPIMILPNGNWIGELFGYEYVMDKDNNIILGSSINYEYIPAGDLILGSEDITYMTTVYDSNGVEVDVFMGFEGEIYPLNDQYIYYIEEYGDSWIVDFEGNKILGPFEGYYFFETYEK